MWRLKGQIKGYTSNSLMIEANIPNDLPVDTFLDIQIKKHSDKRSLNANSYFHTLCDQLRQKLNISMAECKNELITSYGQIEYIDDTPMVYKTNAPPEYIRQLEEIHLKLIKTEGDLIFWYRVYRGSHTYNSKEMAILIDGTIAECKLQGIETMTPNELLRLKGYG